LRRFLIACLALAVLAGCSSWPSLPSLPRLLAPYRVEIQQGNYVTQEQVSQLYKGMTRDQVRYLLGTPLLADPFHADRWDYVFRRLRANSRELEERRLTLFFAEGKLDRVEGDVAVAFGTSPSGAPMLPTAPPAPQAPGASEPAGLPPADSAAGLAPPAPGAAASAASGLPPTDAPAPAASGLPPTDAPGGPSPQNLPPAAQPPTGQQ
jgi:outer membrane protein assembly factor BamE